MFIFTYKQVAPNGFFWQTQHLSNSLSPRKDCSHYCLQINISKLFPLKSINLTWQLLQLHVIILSFCTCVGFVSLAHAMQSFNKIIRIFT